MRSVDQSHFRAVNGASQVNEVMVEPGRKVDHRLTVHRAFLDERVLDFGEPGRERIARLFDRVATLDVRGAPDDALDLMAYVADAGHRR